MDTINDALTRASNNLARCLHNVPEDPDGIPVCGDYIIQGEEECDCGSPQVRFSTQPEITVYNINTDIIIVSSHYAVMYHVYDGLAITLL